MGAKLYVGNLSEVTTGADLERLFASHGTVVSAEVIGDRSTGKSHGYAFVQMGSEPEAQAAIAGLNGTEQQGQPIAVEQARPPRIKVPLRGPRRGGFGDRSGRSRSR